MLQAVLHKKLFVSTSEDTLTSSVIGLMQFLPDDIFWSLLVDSCGSTSQIPTNIGKILNVEFWPRFSAENTCNSSYVEPDVWIEAEEYNVIIEAKRKDGEDAYGQYYEQWEKEITALINEEGSNKGIIFIALGGNASLSDSFCTVNNILYTIHTASWFNLLHAVTVYQKRYFCDIPENISRIFSAVKDAFSVHGYYDVEWLSGFQCESLPPCGRNNFDELLEFDNHNFFEILYTPINKPTKVIF